MNKLLKGFLDLKTILTEFMAGFERALERRKEVEDVATTRGILYPTRATTHHPVEQEAARCLTRFAFKKFAVEWREKDAYATEETTDENATVREFKLWRFERPNVIRRVSYDGRLLACCCRNLEFAGIICRHALAIMLRLSLTTLDSANFPQRWQKDPSELELAHAYVEFYSRPTILLNTFTSQDAPQYAPQESSGETASRIRYLRMNRQSIEITRRISSDVDLCSEFTTILDDFLRRIYSPPRTLSSVTASTSTPAEIPMVRNPVISKTVGRPKKSRIRAEKENHPPQRAQKRARTAGVNCA